MEIERSKKAYRLNAIESLILVVYLVSVEESS